MQIDEEPRTVTRAEMAIMRRDNPIRNGANNPQLPLTLNRAARRRLTRAARAKSMKR